MIFPLHREAMLFLRIALLAGRDYVAFRTFAAADDWNQVIHRKLFSGSFSTAVVAKPRGPLSLPPLAGTQLPGLSALTPNFLITNGDYKWGRLHTVRFLPLKCSPEQTQQRFSRQDAKAQRKISFSFSELSVLCVFARANLPSVVTKNFISPKFKSLWLVTSYIYSTSTNVSEI